MGWVKRERERERELYQIKMRKKNGLGFKERERERTRIQVVEEIIKKIENIDYFNKKCVKIDKLMLVFCKSEGVKQKKQIFSVKIDV